MEGEECWEMKEGEKMREFKCLEVDLRGKKVLRGKKERTRSRSSGGRWFHILGSICGGGDFEGSFWATMDDGEGDSVIDMESLRDSHI